MLKLDNPTSSRIESERTGVDVVACIASFVDALASRTASGTGYRWRREENSATYPVFREGFPSRANSLLEGTSRSPVNVQWETVSGSTAVDARTDEEKRERRALLPKLLPRHTEKTSTSY